MDRKEVEALLYEAERFGGDDDTTMHARATTLADLLRTQLAVWDAEVLEVVERGWREGGPNDGVIYEVPTELVGQRVRTVRDQPEPPQ